MEENREKHQDEWQESAPRSRVNTWLVVLTVITLLGAAGAWIPHHASRGIPGECAGHLRRRCTRIGLEV